MTSLIIWINLFLIASAFVHTSSQVNMTGGRGAPVVKDPSKHHPSATEVAPGGAGADRMSSVEHLIARKLDQAEGRIERRLDERIQLLNQTVTFGHMEKLLHHLNEELLQNRDQLTDQNEDLKRMTSTLELQKQELDAEKENVVSMKMALENLTHLVNHLVEVLVSSKGTTESGGSVGGTSVTGDHGLTTSSINLLQSTPASHQSFPIDCEDAYSRGGVGTSGFYFPVIQPRNSSEPFKGSCFMRNNASWTVIQRRVDGSVDFYRSWTDYKRGFGDLEGEFWLGNDNIHQLTNQGDYMLRIEMVTWDDHTHWAEYRHFRISGEADKYRLHVAGYSGNAGNSLSSPYENDHNGQPFSTRDSDHDNRHYDNCAEHYRGAWWFKSCFQSHLNGVYYPKGSHSNFFVRNGVQWNSIHPHSSLKDVKMMIHLSSDDSNEEMSNGIE